AEVYGWRLGPSGRRFRSHPVRAPHQVELEVHEFGRAVGVGLRAHTGETAAQAALEGAQALPLEPVERISGRMGLSDGAAGELSAPVVVVALGAGEIELALTTEERFATGFEDRPGARVDRNIDRQAARLPRHVGREL